MESLGLYVHASNSNAVPFAGDVAARRGPGRTLSDALIVLTLFSPFSSCLHLLLGPSALRSPLPSFWVCG